MGKRIDVLLYGYKSKSLKSVVDALISNTNSDIVITIIDQNPILRGQEYREMQKVSYSHVRWDNNKSPMFYKKREIENTKADYFLLISDDVIVSKNWDQSLVDFIDSNEDVIISGNSLASVSYKDIFSLRQECIPSSGITKRNYIDRNFIFGKSSTFKEINYPDIFKYNGEEEMLGLLFHKNGIAIFSGGKDTYKDLGARTIDNLYVPFAKDHNYNKLISYIKENKELATEFFGLSGIDIDEIRPLPFENNDPEYDHYDMEFLKIDHTRFLSGYNAVY